MVNGKKATRAPESRSHLNRKGRLKSKEIDDSSACCNISTLFFLCLAPIFSIEFTPFDPPPRHKVSRESIRQRLLRFMKKMIRFCRTFSNLKSGKGDFGDFMLKKNTRNHSKNGYLLKNCTKKNKNCFSDLHLSYLKNNKSGELDRISSTESSPVHTDAVNKKSRSGEVRSTAEKTWNDPYVTGLMSIPKVRFFYMSCIDLLNEGKEDGSGKKLAQALGIQAYEGLYEDLKFMFARGGDEKLPESPFIEEADQFLAI